MKKKVFILLCIALCCLIAAFLLHFARAGVTKNDRRDFAAETFAGQGEMRYGMYTLFCGTDDYLTPDGVMAVRLSLENALREGGIVPDGHYKLVASLEREVTVSRGAVAFTALASVYFGDYHALHPDRLLAGGFPEPIEETTDFCVLDSFAAWRLFGSTDVCGMEVQIGEAYYTVAAVVEPLGDPYTAYYGLTPRVYIRYDSAAMRAENLCFTAIEGILPDPVSDFGKTAFTNAVQSYGDDVLCNTGRFSFARVFEKLRTLSKLGVMEGKTYPYYENVSRVMESKCAMILAFEFPLYLAAGAFCIAGLLCAILPPLRRLRQRRQQKKKHAILS